MVYDPFNVLLGSVCQYFVEDFASMFISENWPAIFFLSFFFFFFFVCVCDIFLCLSSKI